MISLKSLKHFSLLESSLTITWVASSKVFYILKPINVIEGFSYILIAPTNYSNPIMNQNVVDSIINLASFLLGWNGISKRSVVVHKHIFDKVMTIVMLGSWISLWF
jgi:hypothetical protein